MKDFSHGEFVFAPRFAGLRKNGGFMAVRVSENEFEEKVLKSDLPVAVEFYSDSCIPCKKLSPVLGELEDAFSGRIHIVKVNVNFDAALAQKYEVLASPTVLFFKNGEETERVRGLEKKETYSAIMEKLI